MRAMFPGYYTYSKNDFSHLWDEAVFVFDTNVLLSLHVYPDEIRDAYFSVFELISDRCWIPFHVALEYHRNKFAKIRDSSSAIESVSSMIKKFEEDLERKISEVKLDKRNTGISNTDDRFDAIKEANGKLLEVVEEAKSSHPSVSFFDPIGDRICSLFEGKVGVEPNNQKEIDDLLSDAKSRYDASLPPGYADAKKGESRFIHAGISYESRYGDLILWKQLIQYCKEVKIKNIIFVTADQKEDWWLKIDGKTIGPRPELTHEIIKLGGVQMFWMYSVDSFLKYAEKHFELNNVTSDMIEEIKNTVIGVPSGDVFDGFQNEKIKRDINFYKNIIAKDQYLKKIVSVENINECFSHIGISVCEELIIEEYRSANLFFHDNGVLPQFVAVKHDLNFGMDILKVDISLGVFSGLVDLFQNSYCKKITHNKYLNEYDVYIIKIILGASYDILEFEGNVLRELESIIELFSASGFVREFEVGYVSVSTMSYIRVV